MRSARRITPLGIAGIVLAGFSIPTAGVGYILTSNAEAGRGPGASGLGNAGAAVGTTILVVALVMLIAGALALLRGIERRH